LERKFETDNAEKKALEEKIARQKAEIDEYNQALRDIEKKIENEAKQWRTG